MHQAFRIVINHRKYSCRTSVNCYSFYWCLFQILFLISFPIVFFNGRHILGIFFSLLTIAIHMSISIFSIWLINTSYLLVCLSISLAIAENRKKSTSSQGRTHTPIRVSNNRFIEHIHFPFYLEPFVFMAFQMFASDFNLVWAFELFERTNDRQGIKHIETARTS